MKGHAALLILLMTANVSWADDAIPWPKKNASPRVSVDGEGNLIVQGDAKPTTTMVLTLNDPKVPSHEYRFVGRIKYENVVGDGYVEMWNHMPKLGAFFSKTLDPEGSMGKITGSSAWRDLEVPFYSKPGILPAKLVINVVLPGQGKVWIAPLTIQKAEPLPMGADESEETAFPWPVAGGLLSGLVGVLGTLLALFGDKPALRRPAMHVTTLLIPCSCAALLVGVLPWARENNVNVWYPLAVVGGLWLAVFATTAWLLRRKLAQDELRRMQALDATGR